MSNFFLGLFIITMLIIVVPLRIASKFHLYNDKKQLAKSTVISFLLADIFLLVATVCAFFEGKVSGGLFAGSVIIGAGIPLLIALLVIFNRENETEYWDRIYTQTNQKPHEKDYGFSKKNPIWAGTCEDYMKHLVADNGEHFEWKYIKKIDLSKKNDIVNTHGIVGCILFKINIIFDEDKTDTIYIVTKAGLHNMKTWHAPKGYKYTN